MPAALIAPLLVDAGWSTFAVAATTFAIRLATTLAIASLLQPKPPTVGSGTPGGELQLGPATDNKLPVVYGTAYVSPIIVDAILSTDQQTIWYVLAFSETTPGTVSFEEIWYDGKLLMFDPTNPNEIVGWWTRPKKNSKIGGVIEQGPAGSVGMYFYNNGSNQTGTQHRTFGLPGSTYGTGSSYVDGGLKTTDVTAISVLQDGRIPGTLQWTANDKMTNCVFAILRLNYNPNNGVHGLGQMTAKLVNTLNAPGDVIQDYLTNTTYGCAVPLANVNTDSLTRLNTISAAPLEILDTEDNTVTNTFIYELNGIVDTTQDCLTNLDNMAQSCDSWIQWDERLAQWGVIPNQSLLQSGLTTSTMTVVTADQILGGINLVPTDLKASANKITVSFPNADIIGQTDYRYYWLESEFKSPNEPENNIDINYPFCNNSIQGTYLGYRKLWMSREDVVINFSMDYSGIHINAGDIIAVNHEWYGWGPGAYNGEVFPGKPFRVTQIKEAKDDKGFLSVLITAVSYNDSIYTTTNPHYYTPDEFGLLTATNYISQPDAPIITQVNTSTNTFVVQGNIPQYGNVLGMEFWYSVTVPDWVNNNYTLLSTQYYAVPGRGTVYPHYQTDGVTPFYEQTVAVNLPPGDYYFKTRAVGPNTTSDFSDASDYNG